MRAHQRQPPVSPPKKGGVRPPGDAILVGVQVDPAAALQLRDMGPPADHIQVSSHANSGSSAEVLYATQDLRRLSLVSMQHDLTALQACNATSVRLMHCYCVGRRPH